ncbi:MAG: calcium-binding protein, partial [Pseudomonadota bacterium]
MAVIFSNTDSLNGTTAISNGDELIIAAGTTYFEDSNPHVIIMAGGTLETVLANYGTIIGGSTSGETINMDADRSVVINHGTISMVTGNPNFLAAVFDFAGGNSSSGAATDATIVNFGQIDSTGSFSGLGASVGLYNVRIENFGIIATNQQDNFILTTSNQVNADIFNSGTIIAGLTNLKGSGTTTIDNSGTIRLRTLDIGADLGSILVNTGDLTVGDGGATTFVVGGTAADVVKNEGRIDTGLSLNAGDNVITNSGVITGSVFVSGGADSVQNRAGGTIGGDVTLLSGNDTVFNESFIFGEVDLGNGDDVYRGGVASAVLGGIDAGLGFDTVVTGNADDLINAGAGSSSNLVRSGAGSDTITSSAIGNDTLAGEDGDDSISAAAGNNELMGGDGDDTISGGSGSDTIRGGLGEDSIFGGIFGSNLVYGGDGDDEILGASASDTFRGGAGDDTIDGGADGDDLRGGVGDDVIIGGLGDDTIMAGDGNDDVMGGTENDIINGGDGLDTMSGDGGNDLIHGGDGMDLISGGANNDTLHGGAGDDEMSGDDGDDDMFGNAGDDQMTGGAGDDTMTGGGGADTFVIARNDTGSDVITDFSDGTDVLDIS